ncbi:NAD(P)-binding oxidoreductase [Pseudomonas prosekii]|uniref:NAD(P)H-binding n=1 Tax=Pseudomonas prosekii TaxID=1148509 RepID=A0A1H2BWY1_9PSED|nr:NAD(P)-binding oxidoreductase [Pseudomonas prosekii]SDT62266.1 NAD(P)H-binding [Pseudomonas prosekii]
MSKVFIIGAAGRVGRRLIKQLVGRGHEAIALHRNPEQGSELAALGATSVKGNLLELDPVQMARLMSGVDAVVFTAGAGGAGMDLTNAIDGRGLELAVAATIQAGVRRFILVSAFPDALRGGPVSEGFENYIAVKKRADAHLVGTGLDWVIVRPGTLLDDTGSGKIRADVAIPYGEVSRDDVAATLAELIDQPNVSRVIIELTQGDTPVSDAVRRLAQERCSP